MMELSGQQVTRHFLGWDQPVVDAVRAYLMPEARTGSITLDDTLVIVPTRQAGRRLREAMARAAGEDGAGLLALRVAPPSLLLAEPLPDDPPEASSSLVQAVWARVLRTVDPAVLQVVFPAAAAGVRDFPWCLQTGGLLQRLRRELCEAGLSITAVLERHGDVLEEPERWQALAALEGAYLSALDALGVGDPGALQCRRAAAPVLPGSFRRLVVAATPDPPQVVLQAIESLSRSMPVEILVYAPPELASRFDPFGRPAVDWWGRCEIDIPDDVIYAADGLRGQAERVLALIGAAADRFAPTDVVVGVPDEAVTPHLVRVLRDQGLAAADPAERPMAETRIFRLIRGFIQWTGEGSYRSLRQLIRHPDVLARLGPADTILRELDELQNAVLPSLTADVEAALAREPASRPALAAAMRTLNAWVDDGGGKGGGVSLATVRAMLRSVYADRMLNSADETDNRFREAAEATAEVFDALRDESLAGMPLTDAERLALLVQQLADRTVGGSDESSVVDIEGWLELGWNDAPHLILTGMNEGRVPGGRLSDVFLPDTLRTALGLRDDAMRLARDAYWLTAMLAWRCRTGRTAVICGRTGQGGDPLKPSRLLFRCPDRRLAARCAQLFGERASPPPGSATSITFKLAQPPLPPPATFNRVAVTAFRSYLNCPLRFLLGNGLGMHRLADDKREPDPLDFGTLMHEALELLAHEPALAACTDQEVVAARLTGLAAQWIAERYGPQPTLPVRVALEGAQHRLFEFAGLQAALAAEGWELLHGEQKVTLTLDGVTVSGKIDRVDRHRETGEVRIIDYKTGDKAQTPEQAHLATWRDGSSAYAEAPPPSSGSTRRRRWTDLQLPLYILAARQLPACSEVSRAAYANLPKAAADTRLAEWESMSEALLDSALTCACGVLGDIRAGRFWPPATKLTYDDFESLFAGQPVEAVMEAPNG